MEIKDLLSVENVMTTVFLNTIFVIMEFSSKLLEKAVAEMAQLPGIGKRTALRLVLHLLRQPESQTTHLASSLHQMRTNIKHCKECYNISDVTV